MLSDITAFAPAKVNIGLHVLPQRKDGYHNIESIFQTVRLYDQITVTKISESDCCRIECTNFELPAENTIRAAYTAFCRLTGKHTGVYVRLIKHIPAGGGLGGGSSDAASFLKVFARITETELTGSLADAVAGVVGSDVFFFLHSGSNEKEPGCAIVSGRGEIVQPITPRKDLYPVLLFPGVSVSTRDAYGLVDTAFAAGVTVACPEFGDLEKLYRCPVSAWTFKNSFTPVLEKQHAAIAAALADMRSCGALWADMSGSGATVFGIFDSASAAGNASAVLKKTWNFCVLA